MTIPDYQTLMRPVLNFASDGEEKSIQSTIDALAKKFKLSDDEINELLPSGQQTVFSNRVHWARTYLKQSGAIRSTKRSYYIITDRGLKLLKENPDYISNSTLTQFQEFNEFKSRRKQSTTDEVELEKIQTEEELETPTEAIQAAYSQIQKLLKSQLLEKIAEITPEHFEHLVVDLIVGMGYGGRSRFNVAKAVGKSGDGGIDGFINEDVLGLDTVYIQAKSYSPENKVGRPQIQQFAGALIERGSAKGVFVTTSDFSKEAKEYAAKVPQKIVLINGDQLAEMMIQFDIGVRTEEKYEIKKIDLDYFRDDDE